MPEDFWQKARDKEGARRARRPEPDTSCTYEAHIRTARREKDLDERLARVRLVNEVWRLIKEEDSK